MMPVINELYQGYTEDDVDEDGTTGAATGGCDSILLIELYNPWPVPLDIRNIAIEIRTGKGTIGPLALSKYLPPGQQFLLNPKSFRTFRTHRPNASGERADPSGILVNIGGDPSTFDLSGPSADGAVAAMIDKEDQDHLDDYVGDGTSATERKGHVTSVRLTYSVDLGPGGQIPANSVTVDKASLFDQDLDKYGATLATPVLPNEMDLLYLGSTLRTSCGRIEPLFDGVPGTGGGWRPAFPMVSPMTRHTFNGYNCPAGQQGTFESYSSWAFLGGFGGKFGSPLDLEYVFEWPLYTNADPGNPEVSGPLTSVPPGRAVIDQMKFRWLVPAGAWQRAFANPHRLRALGMLRTYTDPTSDKVVPGRININLASRGVLMSLPYADCLLDTNNDGEPDKTLADVVIEARGAAYARTVTDSDGATVQFRGFLDYGDFLSRMTAATGGSVDSPGQAGYWKPIIRYKERDGTVGQVNRFDAGVSPFHTAPNDWIQQKEECLLAAQSWFNLVTFRSDTFTVRVHSVVYDRADNVVGQRKLVALVDRSAPDPAEPRKCVRVIARFWLSE
jgi:hypothetical protein